METLPRRPKPRRLPVARGLPFGNDLREAMRPTVIEVNGVKYAFVASVSAETWITRMEQVEEEKGAVSKRRRWMRRRPPMKSPI